MHQNLELDNLPELCEKLEKRIEELEFKALELDKCILKAYQIMVQSGIAEIKESNKITYC